MMTTASYEHFRHHVFATISHMVDQLALSYGSVDAAIDTFPFLADYADQSRTAVGPPGSGPLDRLRRAAALDDTGIMLLLAAGLIDEDARFGVVFEAFQSSSGQQRPTLGLLEAWWRDEEDCHDVRASLRRLLDARLVHVRNSDAPRLERTVEPSPGLWEALRGERHHAPLAGVHYSGPETLLPLDRLVLSPAVRELVERLPAQLLASGSAVVVRGPGHNGRRTLIGALARRLGRGLLTVRALDAWSAVGSLATVLDALPVLVLDLAPGETADIPRLSAYDGPVGVVLDYHGGLSGPAVETAVEIRLDVPAVAERAALWRLALSPAQLPDTTEVAERFRMTSGHILRAADLARAQAALDTRGHLLVADIQQASRAMNRQALDTLASRITASGDWSQLVVAADTLDELRRLEARCRHRERLAWAVGPAISSQLSHGVRALFSGPSGTGKTLAARLLASALQLDLYRLDLAGVVNKYIGETEKNLNRIFQRAEQLGIVLLLDEGDALLTQRTSVHSSNDRYANLETNYLLQRLETFEGILLVTSNASQRIDSAFLRRLDVVIDFRPPEPTERLAIWQLHLPTEHAIDAGLLEDVARRCALSGGAIRNAVLHAAVLALDEGPQITSEHLEASVQREYRKLGLVCPLRRMVAV